MFATGRHHVDVAQIRDGLGIDAYMITSNGARVHNTKGELIFKHNVDPEIAHELCLMEFDHPDLVTNYYGEMTGLLTVKAPNRKSSLKNRYFSTRYLIAITLILQMFVKSIIPVKITICW